MTLERPRGFPLPSAKPQVPGEPRDFSLVDLALLSGFWARCEEQQLGLVGRWRWLGALGVPVLTWPHGGDQGRRAGMCSRGNESSPGDLTAGPRSEGRARPAAFSSC